MVKFCSKCKKILPVESVFCSTCGNQNLLAFCQNCKKMVPNGMRSCPTCESEGTKQVQIKTTKESTHKKENKKSGAPLLFLIFAVVLSFSGGVFVGENNFFSKKVNYVAITNPVIRLYEGDSQKLAYRVTPYDAVHEDAQWESSDPSIASVSSNGLIKGEKIGTCTVTISVEGKTDEALVMILEDAPLSSFVSPNDEGQHSYDGPEEESNTDDTSSYVPSHSSTTVSDDYKLALFTLAQEEVKNRLKSPSSAKFPINYLGDEVQYERNGDRYTIASWVEAENSFGAMLRQQFMLSTTISGGKMKDIICIIG